MFPDCSKQLGFSRNTSHIKKSHYTALKMTSSIQSSSFNFLSFLLLFSSRFQLVKKIGCKRLIIKAKGLCYELATDSNKKWIHTSIRLISTLYVQNMNGSDSRSALTSIHFSYTFLEKNMLYLINNENIFHVLHNKSLKTVYYCKSICTSQCLKHFWLQIVKKQQLLACTSF